jgi:protein-glutamine gamma-glutamyltransferase
MKDSTATLCSLSIGLWGYQTGAWFLAIPMVLALEVRPLIKYRWSISWEYFKSIHGLTVFLWFLAIFYIPMTSPSPIPYAASYHILKCLPVGFFPLILAQTYCRNFTSFYRSFFNPRYGGNKTIDLYYPYFGICLLAASVTGGNTFLFLMFTGVLMAGLLGALRSQRFSLKMLYALIGLALLLTLIGTNQFYALQQTNFKLDGSAVFRNLIQNVASFAFKENTQQKNHTFNTDSWRKAEQRTEILTTKTPQSITRPTGVPESSPSPGSSQDHGLPQHVAQATPSTDTVDSAKGTTLQSHGSSQSVAQRTQSSNGDSSQDGNQRSEDTGNTTNTPATESSPADTSTPAGTANPSLTDSAPGLNQRDEDTSRSNPLQSSQDIDRNPGRSNTEAPSGLRQGAGGAIDPQTSLTQIGKSGSLELSDAVLFRVTPNTERRSNHLAPTFPLYIREATYNQYRLGAWNAVKPEFVSRNSQSNKRRWIFGSQTSKTTSVHISTRLPGHKAILKLPIGTSEIDQLPVDSMQVNQYGTVAVQGKPGEITYTVQFDPTQSFESPPTPLEMDVPQVEQPAMQQILKSLDLSGKSARETVQTISAFFKQGFQYSLDLHQPPKNTTPLSAFLLEHRSGHCEYFASATSLLLRSAGIPTRYAVGYFVHEYNHATQQYIVRAQNAHAWVLAYVDGSWITVETTPAGELTQGGTSPTPAEGKLPETGAIATISEDKQSQGNQAHTAPEPDQKNPGKKTTSFSEKVSDAIKNIKSLPEKVSKAGSSLFQQLSKHLDSMVWPGAIITTGLAIILCSLFFVWRVIRRKRSRHSKWMKESGFQVSKQPTVDGLDSEFYLIESRLGEWGLERQSSETVRQWIARLKQKLPAAKMNHLDQIIDLHYRYRFDPQGIAQEDRAKLRSMIQSWLVEAS